MSSMGKLRWGDTIDDEDVLPPTTVKGPDDNGVKTTIEYYKNDRGDPIKKTTKVKIVTIEKKVYKVTEERRQWKKFGGAVRDTPQDSVTVQGAEEIPFERVRQQKATTAEKKVTDMQTILATQDKASISGSLKDMLYKKRMERELLRAKGLLKEAERPPGEDDKPASILSGAPKAGSYVPPSMRGGAGASRPGGPEGDSMQRRREENSVRVTNLSEDVSEADLTELFRPFGAVSRVFVAVNRETGENRGFAFVNFVHRDEGERAIRALNGYGYDNLILRVEWAAPRAERA